MVAISCLCMVCKGRGATTGSPLVAGLARATRKRQLEHTSQQQSPQRMRMSDVKMLTRRVGFIGAGQMAEALARGFIAKGVLQAGDITANDPSAERKKVFESFDANTAASNIEVQQAKRSRQCQSKLKSFFHCFLSLTKRMTATGCGKKRDCLPGSQAAVCAACAEGSARAPYREAYCGVHCRRQDAVVLNGASLACLQSPGCTSS